MARHQDAITQPTLIQNRKSSRRSPGFSLTELLIAAAVGSVLMVGAIAMILSHTRSMTRAEALISLQDSWNRVQFLLNQDIQEARGTPTLTACNATSNEGVLVLAIPIADGSTTSITYALSDATLTRTGPAIEVDGTLSETETANDQVVMTGVKSFCPSNTSGEINYLMELQSASGVTYQNQSEPSGDHTRSRIIN